MVRSCVFQHKWGNEVAAVLSHILGNGFIVSQNVIIVILHLSLNELETKAEVIQLVYKSESNVL